MDNTFFILYWCVGFFSHCPSKDLELNHTSCLFINLESKWYSGNTIGFAVQGHGSKPRLLLPVFAPSD